jgi:hypothetical protein
VPTGQIMISISPQLQSVFSSFCLNGTDRRQSRSHCFLFCRRWSVGLPGGNDSGALVESLNLNPNVQESWAKMVEILFPMARLAMAAAKVCLSPQNTQ